MCKGLIIKKVCEEEIKRLRKRIYELEKDNRRIRGIMEMINAAEDETEVFDVLDKCLRNEKKPERKKR